MFFWLACTARIDGKDSKTENDDSVALYTPIPSTWASLQADPSTVVVVTIDTLRADHLSAYGYSRQTMPFLDSLDHVTLSSIYGTTSWTPPSIASFMTGLPPEQHGILWPQPQSDSTCNHSLDVSTIATHLKENGYQTGLFSGNPFVGDETGMSAGFDKVYIGHGTAENRASVLVAQALSWLEGVPDKQKAFVWIQPMNAHSPYLPAEEVLGVWSDMSQYPVPLGTGLVPEGADEHTLLAGLGESERAAAVQTVKDVYDETILSVDRALVDFWSGLQAQRRQNAMLMVWGDHGETLDDAGDLSFGHGSTLRPELTHLPVVVVYPGLQAETVDCLGSVEDLGATLLDLVGEGTAWGKGKSVRATCRNRTQASLVDTNGYIREIVIEDTAWRMTVSCLDGQSRAFSRSTDPYALHPDALSILPDPTAWEAEGDTLLSELLASPWGLKCASAN